MGRKMKVELVEKNFFTKENFKDNNNNIPNANINVNANSRVVDHEEGYDDNKV